MKRLQLTIENYRASVQGRKTQTRRVITGAVAARADAAYRAQTGAWEFVEIAADGPRHVGTLRPPFYAGEVVALALPHWRSKSGTIYNPAVELCVHKRANGAVSSYLPGCPIPPPGREARWRRLPAHLMPLWACLHYVRILDVRPERLRDITPADALAEGVHCAQCNNTGTREFWMDGEPIGELCPHPGVREEFAAQWDSINAKRGCPWSANPWVWVYDYCLTTPPYVDTRGPWL